jgi:hypothetical protein
MSCFNKIDIVDSFKILHWRFFNFFTRRIMASCFICGGLILFVYGLPSILPGGTVQLNGQPTDDLVFRLFSALIPLIVTALGVFLFRANPYYPTFVIRTLQEVERDRTN